jgi:hypothetical protein
MPNPPGTGLPNPASYDTSTPGVVVDRVTCLQWEQPANGPQGPQSSAQAYCAGLSLAGHSDWRLPTIIELVSIVDFTTWNPAIDLNAFPGTPVDAAFWSSSQVAGDPAATWYVHFAGGYTYSDTINYGYRVRCVR